MASTSSSSESCVTFFLVCFVALALFDGGFAVTFFKGAAFLAFGADLAPALSESAAFVDGFTGTSSDARLKESSSSVRIISFAVRGAGFLADGCGASMSKFVSSSERSATFFGLGLVLGWPAALLGPAMENRGLAAGVPSAADPLIPLTKLPTSRSILSPSSLPSESLVRLYFFGAARARRE